MIVHKLGNSYSQVEGLSINEMRELRELLSYSIDPKANYFAGGYRSPKRYLIDAKGNYPSGLNYLVEGFLDNIPRMHSILDSRQAPKSKPGMFKLSLEYTPYPEQVVAVEACKRYKRGTISAVTGFGKSITMALLVEALQVKTLIIVPNTTLKRQLTDSFLQYFGSLNNITIENIDSPKLKNAKDYDCLIIDECHHSAAKTYRSLNKHSWNKIYYRFAFTATPFRSREEEQLLYESVAGQVIYQVSYHTAVKQGYICPVEAYYYEIPKTKIQSNSWPQVYSTLVVNNSVRNRIISELLSSLNHNKVSTLCLVKEIKHGETLSEYCKLQFANGINEDSKDIIHFFNQGKLTAIIGTNGVVGEGVDTKPAEFIVIAGLGKSKNQFLQQVGRGLRKYPGKESCKVIIFYDPSHKWTKEHYKAQCKYLLDEYNIIPVKLDLPNT